MASKFEIFIDVFIGIFILVALIAPLSPNIGNNFQVITGSQFPPCKPNDAFCFPSDGDCCSGHCGCTGPQNNYCTCIPLGSLVSTTTSTTTTIPVNCSQYTSCYNCAYAIGCGWCNNLNQCKNGTISGPRDGSCSGGDWLFYPDQCTSATTTSSSTSTTTQSITTTTSSSTTTTSSSTTTTSSSTTTTQPQCNEGGYRCVAQNLERCTNGIWQFVQSCTYDCLADHCVPPPTITSTTTQSTTTTTKPGSTTTTSSSTTTTQPTSLFTYSNFICSDNTNSCGMNYANQADESLVIAFYLLRNHKLTQTVVFEVAKGSSSFTAPPFSCNSLESQYNVMFQAFLKSDTSYGNPIKSPTELKIITCP